MGCQYAIQRGRASDHHDSGRQSWSSRRRAGARCPGPSIYPSVCSSAAQEGPGRGEGQSEQSNVPEGVQYGAARLLATDRLELQERSVWLLLQRCVESTNGHDQARSFHARAGEDVPAEADAIAVLYLAPLLFQSLVIHPVAVSKGTRCDASIICGLACEGDVRQGRGVSVDNQGEIRCRCRREMVYIFCWRGWWWEREAAGWFDMDKLQLLPTTGLSGKVRGR